MSASRNSIPWNSAIGRPNCYRSLRVATARSSAAWARPGRAGRDAQPARVEGGQGDLHPLALGADSWSAVDRHGVEVERGGRSMRSDPSCAPAHRSSARGRRRARWKQEIRGVRSSPVRANDGVEVGLGAVGDPRLGAAQGHTRRRRLGPGGHAGDVRTGLRPRTARTPRAARRRACRAGSARALFRRCRRPASGVAGHHVHRDPDARRVIQAAATSSSACRYTSYGCPAPPYSSG